ncbi:peptidoglycan-binding protein [Leptolyngbya sp. 15MV]|nr:peptidoglycan-binding protein [Leptolyngbya sp. 15MV]
MLEMGARGDAVRAIQQMLGFLGYRGLRRKGSGFEPAEIVADGAFGGITETAVLAFQRDHGLYADGRVGEVTLEALRKAHALRHTELAAPGPIIASNPVAGTGLLPWERCEADAWGGGYSAGWLLADAAAAYRRVLADARRQGALLTSSGMKRELHAPVGASRSATSMHYTGRAIDLFIYGAMQNTAKDACVAQRIAERRYRIWARCAPERAATPADLPPRITVPPAIRATRSWTCGPRWPPRPTGSARSGACAPASTGRSSRRRSATGGTPRAPSSKSSAPAARRPRRPLGSSPTGAARSPRRCSRPRASCRAAWRARRSTARSGTSRPPAARSVARWACRSSSCTRPGPTATPGARSATGRA